MKDEVITWLMSGAEVKKGVVLMQRAGAPFSAIRMVETHPERNGMVIRTWLMNRFGIIPSDLHSDGDKSIRQNGCQTSHAFRDDFPFLNDPDCPVQLEALASRKITRYHEYVKLHSQLRFCQNLQQCSLLCGQVINSFIENRAIYAELNYYKEHHALLGKHPIFASYNRRKDMLNMSIKDLVKRKTQLEDNIWRVKNEIKKGTKPHLDVSRRERLYSYQAELAEVNRLLNEE